MMSPRSAIRQTLRLAVTGPEQLIVDDLAGSPAGSPIEGVDFVYNWNSLIYHPNDSCPAERSNLRG